jgi:uncharacterized protein YecE (DUF72 family)
MQYGRIDKSLLGEKDLSLPPDHPQTNAVLSGKKNENFQVQVGCAKWGLTDWVGKIYPPKTKSADFLAEYAKQFTCVELNAIFYKLPTHQQIDSWKRKVPPYFKFCPKFTEAITHEKKLQDVERELNEFVEMMRRLGANAGPVFLMPHPQMSPVQWPLIQSFLKSVPEDIQVFTEFRHSGFFSEPNFPAIFSWLQENNFGSVITDTAGERQSVHMRLTTPHAFIRFVGNSLHPTDYTRINDWVKRIKQWQQAGLQSCWFFVHQHEELFAPELCKYFMEELNKACGLSLKPPVFFREERDLFSE